MKFFLKEFSERTGSRKRYDRRDCKTTVTILTFIYNIEYWIVQKELIWQGAERMTDEELYRCYLDGDEDGLTELMDRYGSALTLYIDGYLGDIHEAEDLMIEVFSYLLTKRPRIRDGGLKAYLYKAARHMVLRHKTRRPVVFSLEDLAEEPEAGTLIEEVIKDREHSRILHLCMERLHTEYRGTRSRCQAACGADRKAETAAQEPPYGTVRSGGLPCRDHRTVLCHARHFGKTGCWELYGI